LGRAAKQVVDQEAEKPLVLFERLVNVVRTPRDETRIAGFKYEFLTKSAKNTKAPSSFVKLHRKLQQIQAHG
jgi:hypothetical protein